MWYEQNVAHRAQPSVSMICQTHLTLSVIHRLTRQHRIYFLYIYDIKHHIVDGDVIYVFVL